MLKDATGRFYPEVLDLSWGKNAHLQNNSKQNIKIHLNIVIIYYFVVNPSEYISTME